MELVERIAKIYSILKATYRADDRLTDQRQRDELIRWGQLKPEDQDKPDYYFVFNVCWGPWREERQSAVWKTAYQRFKDTCQGDLRMVNESTDLGLPLAWERDRVCKMGSFLRDRGMSFSEFLESLKGKSGLEARDEFKRILGAGGNKTLSTFIRDYLNLNVFPIDRRVNRMLSSLGLPRDESEVVRLCDHAGVNPKEFDRMLFRYYDQCRGKGACLECKLAQYCEGKKEGGDQWEHRKGGLALQRNSGR